MGCMWPGCEIVIRAHNSHGTSEGMRAHIRDTHYADFTLIQDRLKSTQMMLAEIEKGFSHLRDDCTHDNCGCIPEMFD